VGGLSKLWCSLRCDPALGSDADAAHPSHDPDQVTVSIGQEIKRFVGQRREVPFNRTTTRRFEVEQHRAGRAKQPVCRVRASVQRTAASPVPPPGVELRGGGARRRPRRCARGCRAPRVSAPGGRATFEVLTLMLEPGELLSCAQLPFHRGGKRSANGLAGSRPPAWRATIRSSSSLPPWSRCLLAS
jgi:hypothetical protein